MADFREELIETMAQGVFDSETVGPLDALVDEQPIRDIVTAALNAALAFRQTVECPECGGKGVILRDNIDGEGFRSAGYYTIREPCPAGCIDGRVLGETRLAIVERQVGWLYGNLLTNKKDYPFTKDDELPWLPVFLLASSPEGTPE